MRDGDAAGEQRRENPSGRSRFVQFLADQHRVDGVATAAAHRLRQFGTEQPRVGGAPMQVAGQLAVALPVGDVRQDLAFGEAAHRLAQLH